MENLIFEVFSFASKKDLLEIMSWNIIDTTYVVGTSALFVPGDLRGPLILAISANFEES